MSEVRSNSRPDTPKSSPSRSSVTNSSRNRISLLAAVAALGLTTAGCAASKPQPAADATSQTDNMDDLLTDMDDLLADMNTSGKTDDMDDILADMDPDSDQPSAQTEPSPTTPTAPAVPEKPTTPLGLPDLEELKKKIPELSQIPGLNKLPVYVLTHPSLQDMLDPNELKNKLPEIWAWAKQKYPNVPLEQLLPKIPEALAQESFDPLIKAYCLDKFPDAGLGHSVCVGGLKTVARQKCANADQKVQELCSKNSFICKHPKVREKLDQALKACKKATK